MQEISFDIIGDLFLSPDDIFDWEGKQTSLYCIVAGNISSDVRVVKQTLMHLSGIYQGVFYVPGTLEYETSISVPERLQELIQSINRISNTCMLHQHVAVIDGVAVVGVNGWCNAGKEYTFEDLVKTVAREEDIAYLRNTLTKLQRHLDVKKIVVVTNAVPHVDLYYKENPDFVEDQTPICSVLSADTEKKVAHWVFGTQSKLVETTIDNIHYLNNPKPSASPYWAKRLEVLV